MLSQIETWDERRDWIVLKSAPEAIAFAVDHWVHSAQRAIQQRGFFAVALSGGSTPKAIYRAVTQRTEIDWSQVFLFWSDERSVPPNHPESNYRMALEAGFQNVPIPPHQIFRMVAEKEIEKEARSYEEMIHRLLGKTLFDLVMLGVGPDGHTASLFPNAPAISIEDRLVVATAAADGKTPRMSLTFSCINESQHSALYVLGEQKKEIAPLVLNAPIDSAWPASKIGTVQHKALWIMDKEAASHVKK